MGEFPKTVKYILLLSFLVVFTSGCSVPFLPGGQNQDSDLADDSFIDSSADENLPPAAVNNEQKQEQAEEGTIAEDGTIILGNDIVSVNIDPVGRTSPFVPYKEKNLLYGAGYMYNDMPLPTILGENDDTLIQLVSAKVTGILYDTTSPSAIINVLDEDYLVKPGDEIESFQISSITKDYVAIKTGSNIYRAKVGDIVDGELYGSGIYNLGSKFAGRRRPANKDEVLIVATKRKASQDAAKKHENTDFGNMSLPPVPEVIPAGGGKINLKTQAGEIPLPVGGLGMGESGKQDTN